MQKSAARTVPESDVRTKIKRAARQLFAERGFRNVTVREIATAAGQKNHGAVTYYFGTKDNLAKEILIDGAKIMEARRSQMLDALESSGKALCIRDLIEAIILPSADLDDGDSAQAQTFNRFLLDLSAHYPVIFAEALGERWNVGYQRCLAHMRGLMPGLSTAEQNRRFVFLGTYLGSILALREAMLSDQSRSHPIWQSGSTLDDIVNTAVAMVSAPKLA